MIGSKNPLLKSVDKIKTSPRVRPSPAKPLPKSEVKIAPKAVNKIKPQITPKVKPQSVATIKPQFRRNSQAKSQICNKLQKIIETNLHLIGRLDCVLDKKCPILLKIPSGKDKCEGVVDTVKDEAILALLKEAEKINTPELLYDSSFGHLLIIKFLPLYQDSTH